MLGHYWHSMKSKFDEVSDWGARWLGKSAWQPHTVDKATAEKLVTGYKRFLERIADVNLAQLTAIGDSIDIGCGAGFITSAFKHQGMSIVASEYEAATVAFAQSMQPGVNFHEADLSTFIEPNRYAMIFTREVYLFTRVNDFDRQRQVLSNLIESLRPGGVLLLVVSQHSKPDCLDLRRAINLFRHDSRVSRVTDRYLEPVFKHFCDYIFGIISYRLITLILAPYVAIQKLRRQWAPSFLVAFVKSK